ncbi:unnamed protein product [Acanthoscelides obtectus]|uniref:Uncharacterized protein n=1 Tax=Acanthoscelides obtectus TaxID=200917 RepID=A0A9P0LAR0_ACAOB|nr:unnamed protein product [Acanthoscelides obtectus]CAK1635951.1 hypothetical protein AOBTE_LOCUS9650 [Acanthoscelides obtectus]
MKSMMSSRTQKIIQLATDETAAATKRFDDKENISPVSIHHYNVVENVLIETVETPQTADLSLSLLENYDFMIPMTNSALEDMMDENMTEDMSVDEAQSTGITKTKERIVEDKNEYIVEKESEKII